MSYSPDRSCSGLPSASLVRCVFGVTQSRISPSLFRLYGEVHLIASSGTPWCLMASGRWSSHNQKRQSSSFGPRLRGSHFQSGASGQYGLRADGERRLTAHHVVVRVWARLVFPRPVAVGAMPCAIFPAPSRVRGDMVVARPLLS